MVNSYIALDLETTGLNPKEDRIIEIGAVRVVDGAEIGVFSSLVNPRRELPERAADLTGITGDMLRSAPGIEEVIREAADFCGDLPLLGHNIRFDYSFFKRAALNWGDFSQWEKNGVDTLALCRKFMPKEEKKSLACACRYFQIVNESAHRAVSDARAAHRLYQELICRYGKEHPEAFSEKPLFCKVKKEQPATKRQKERLHDLIKYHKIDVSVQIEHLTRNEASRLTDQILSRYGRIVRGECND